MDAAFSKAKRVTFVGSIIPAAIIFSYLSSRALYPKSSLPARTAFTTTEASPPALATIVLNGDSTA